MPSLVGPLARIPERLAAWKQAPVTTLLLGKHDVGTLRAIAALNAAL